MKVKPQPTNFPSAAFIGNHLNFNVEPCTIMLQNERGRLGPSIQAMAWCIPGKIARRLLEGYHITTMSALRKDLGWKLQMMCSLLVL